MRLVNNVLCLFGGAFIGNAAVAVFMDLYPSYLAVFIFVAGAALLVLGLSRAAGETKHTSS